MSLGTPRLHLRSTDSTSDRARELAAAGAPHGSLVTASLQTAGRGRQGRSWVAPGETALLMSLLLRSPPALLPLIAAVAVCDVLPQALIKWPNDIVVAGPHGLRKLGGILAEGRPQEGWAVLGIGLNVAVELEQLPADVRAGAATLGLSRDAIEPLLAQLLAALERRLAQPAEATLEAWRARDALRGRPVAWATRRGTAHGIDGHGRLVVALSDGGQVALEAGEVHLREP
jgi:BirA family transcriptional regulator, biotin operon repressor / biotin---[acetyl-CoA-carboxylase] ligase